MTHEQKQRFLSTFARTFIRESAAEDAGITRLAENGYMGSGGGSVTKYDLYVGPSGAGGDGVVIIYGIPV